MPESLDAFQDRQFAWEVDRGAILGSFFTEVDAARQDRDASVGEVLQSSGWTSDETQEKRPWTIT